MHLRSIRLQRERKRVHPLQLLQNRPYISEVSINTCEGLQRIQGISTATMSRIVIRRAVKRDASAFLTLVNALADYEKLKRPTPAARKRLILDGFGKKRRFDALLAFADQKPVGYAIIFETYSSFLALPTLYLEDLFILPEYRKQKIGWQLFRTCVQEAKSRGCGRMEWVVLDWNTLAINFYDQLGAKRLKAWLPYRLSRNEYNRVLSK